MLLQPEAVHWVIHKQQVVWGSQLWTLGSLRCQDLLSVCWEPSCFFSSWWKVRAKEREGDRKVAKLIVLWRTHS